MLFKILYHLMPQKGKERNFLSDHMEEKQTNPHEGYVVLVKIARANAPKTKHRQIMLKKSLLNTKISYKDSLKRLFDEIDMKFKEYERATGDRITSEETFQFCPTSLEDEGDA